MINAPCHELSLQTAGERGVIFCRAKVTRDQRLPPHAQKKAIARSSERTSLSNDGAAANESFPPVAGVIGDPGSTLSTALASTFIALVASAVDEAMRPENLCCSKTLNCERKSHRATQTKTEPQCAAVDKNSRLNTISGALIAVHTARA